MTVGEIDATAGAPGRPGPADPGARLADRLGGELYQLACAALPAATIGAAKDRLLHVIGVTLASSGLPVPAAAWQAVRADDGPCTVIGRPGRLSAASAAFANAVAAHSSLLEDCGPGGLSEGSHPGTYVPAAAFAAAEQVGASGADLLAAVVVGYEAVGVLGGIAPVSIVARRFRPLGVLGPIGAAAAAAMLYGCDRRQLAAAISIAANTAAGYGQGFVAGSTEPYLHAGFAARNGLLAASLAAAGCAAAPDSLEGPYGFFQTYGGDAGRIPPGHAGHAVTRLGTKKFAACLQNQETLSLIQARLPVPLAPEAVRRVALFRPATPSNGTASPGVGTGPPYDTMLQRQMSARFTAAAALLGRPVDDVRYFEAAGDDDDVATLAALIELHSTDDPVVRIDVDLRDGTRLTAAGDMSAVLFPTSREITDRFRGRAASVLGPATQDVISLIGQLERLPAAASLLSVLRPATRSHAETEAVP
jgi:2-methylcitrate dehydratase PrpD